MPERMSTGIGCDQFLNTIVFLDLPLLVFHFPASMKPFSEAKKMEFWLPRAGNQARCQEHDEVE